MDPYEAATRVIEFAKTMVSDSNFTAEETEEFWTNLAEQACD